MQYREPLIDNQDLVSGLFCSVSHHTTNQKWQIPNDQNYGGGFMSKLTMTSCGGALMLNGGAFLLCSGDWHCVVVIDIVWWCLEVVQWWCLDVVCWCMVLQFCCAVMLACPAREGERDSCCYCCWRRVCWGDAAGETGRGGARDSERK